MTIKNEINHLMPSSYFRTVNIRCFLFISCSCQHIISLLLYQFSLLQTPKKPLRTCFSPGYYSKVFYGSCLSENSSMLAQSMRRELKPASCNIWQEETFSFVQGTSFFTEVVFLAGYFTFEIVIKFLHEKQLVCDRTGVLVPSLEQGCKIKLIMVQRRIRVLVSLLHAPTHRFTEYLPPPPHCSYLVGFIESSPPSVAHLYQACTK